LILCLLDITREDRPVEIPKVRTGIKGFDQITGGGLPRKRTTLVLGSPGSGKTVFALQALVSGAKNGEPGIFIAFEEPMQQVRENAAVFDWGAASLTDKELAYFDAQLSPDVVTGGDFDLNGLLATVGAKARQMGASTVAFDGLDVLLSMLPDENAEKRELHRTRQWLLENGLTGILTAKVEDSSPADAMRFNFIHYASDCVVLMTNQLSDRVSARSLQVLKYRGSKHSTNQFAVIISDSGLEVEGFAPDVMSHVPSSERVSSGIPELDDMLQGGYYRGSCVLVSGVPGAAKTTLAGASAYASCKRGEPVVFVSYEDAAETMVRNFQTIGMDFRPFIQNGLMNFCALRSTTFSTEQHVVNLKQLAEKHSARTVTVDPVSALLRSSSDEEAGDAAIRLVDYAKTNGITLLITSMPDYGPRGPASTPMEISTMADVWLHVAFVNVNGGRQREFTVLKARGTAHSDQVKQLVIGKDGVRLLDAHSNS
jgi:circadian clock protein KaiC